MNYNEAVEFLNKSFVSFQTDGRVAYNEGLSGIKQICKYLDNPQKNYLTIHVAGTNGKGSVSHMLASVLQAAGYCVGLFTSPHLNDFRERIRVDGELITEKAVARFMESHGSRMVDMGLSYFEMTTAMAFDYFSESDVEVAIIETGLGGRLDATNIISPVLSVVTNIGLDHTDILGDTLQKIAAEKAGIIKHGVPVLIGESLPETDAVFAGKAAEMQAKIVFADKAYECVEREVGRDSDRYVIQRVRDGRMQTLDLDMQGLYQSKNIVTVRAAVSMLRHDTPLSISSRALQIGIRSVVASTGIRGRWEVLAGDPLTVCDTGHNAHGLREVVNQIQAQQYNKLYMVIGFANDKALSDILPLLPREAYYIFTQADSKRALPASELAEIAAKEALQGEVAVSVKDALARARALASADDMIFIGGSSFVVAEILNS